MVRSVAVCAAAALLVLTAGCSTTVSGTAAAAKGSDGPRPPVSVDDLQSHLLPESALNDELGATGMVQDGTVRTTLYPADPSLERACVGVADSGNLQAYDGSGWIAARTRTVHQPGDNYPDGATETVVAFPTAGDAQAFVDAAAKAWPSCANRRYTYKYPGDKYPGDTTAMVWTVGLVSTNDGILTATKTQEGGDGWACRRALTAAVNVVVDVDDCSYRPLNDAAPRIAHDVRAQITG